jgi:hypothetical protein
VDWLPASAAMLAAVTSVATLVVTTVVGGRRDQRRWARDALTEAFVAFLDASWRCSDALRARQAAGSGDPTEAQRQGRIASDAYADMRSTLTRLRLLAGSNVVDKGVALLKRQQRAIEAPPSSVQAALEEASHGRRSLIEAAKREMGLV